MNKTGFVVSQGGYYVDYLKTRTTNKRWKFTLLLSQICYIFLMLISILLYFFYSKSN